MFIDKFFRGNAGFAFPKFYEFLDDEASWYGFRKKSNSVLEGPDEQLLTRIEFKADGKTDVRHHDFEDKASRSAKSRRMVAKVTWFADQLFPANCFIVNNWNWSAQKGVELSNQQGTVERWIKEGNFACNWTRLFCHDFADNQVPLQLFWHPTSKISYGAWHCPGRLATGHCAPCKPG